MTPHDSSRTRPNFAHRKEISVRIFICMVLTMATLLAAPAAMAERDDGPAPATGWMMAVDFMFVRPPSFVMSIVSTGVFIGTVPITFPIGASSHLGTYMIKAPWRFTTARYFGNFHEYRDHRTIRGTEITD